MSTTSRHLVIMAAGTGGHILPGLAVADEMKRRGWTVSWLGTEGGMENRLVPPTGIELDAIAFNGLRGKSLKDTLFGGVRLLKAFVDCYKILSKRQAAAVLGMGGYVCFPGGVMSAARMLPLVMVNADAAMLLSNKALLPITDVLACGFDGPAARHKVSRVTGNPVRAIPCNVGDPAEVAAAFAAVRRDFGRLDVLVNNAGSNVSPALLEDIPFEEWSSILAANLTGAFLCTQQAFKLMKDQTPRGGRIINNGSISATTPRPNSAPYTATKHAITGLTKSTALDGRKYDIACGQIDIGNAATDMTARMNAGVLQANGEIASEPTMSVKHVADAVIYMASLPLDANVLNMTVMATTMPLVGRG